MCKEAIVDAIYNAKNNGCYLLYYNYNLINNFFFKFNNVLQLEINVILCNLHYRTKFNWIIDQLFNYYIAIENTEFICGKAESVLPDLVDKLPSDNEVIAIVDPPRSGLR